MDKLSEDQKHQLKLALIRNVINTFGEVDADRYADADLSKLITDLDSLNQSRVRYLADLADYLYEAIRPRILSPEEMLGKTSQEAEAEDLPIDTSQEVPKGRSVFTPEGLAPLPKAIELPQATLGEPYDYSFDLSSYIEGVVFGAECEGLDKIPKLQFTPKDMRLSGIPEIPGSHVFALDFLAHGKMQRDYIELHLTVTPNLGLLPEAITLSPAKTETPYKAKIPIDRSYKYDFKLEEADESMQMVFDPVALTISGTFTKPGIFRCFLTFKWEGFHHMEPSKIPLELEVTSAPQEYWEDKFPDKNARYPKPLEEKKYLGVNERTYLLGASLRGKRHCHEGLHRQDDFQIRYRAHLGWVIIAVADGAEAMAYSRKGSELACKVAEQVVSKRLEAKKGEEEELFAQLKAGISDAEDRLNEFLSYALTTAVYNAHLYIKRFAASESVDVEDFDTTLQLLIARPLEDGKYFVAGITVGDGVSAVYHHESGTLNLINDPNWKAGEGHHQLLVNPLISEDTQSLNQRIRYFFPDAFSAVLVMSKGAESALIGDDKELSEFAKWQKMWLSLKKEVLEKGKREDKAERLLEWVGQEANGAYEDRTIAMFVRR